MKIKIKYSELEKKKEKELLSLLQKQKVFLIRTRSKQQRLGSFPEIEKGNIPKLQREIKKNIARINKRLDEIKNETN